MSPKSTSTFKSIRGVCVVLCCVVCVWGGGGSSTLTNRRKLAIVPRRDQQPKQPSQGGVVLRRSRQVYIFISIKVGLCVVCMVVELDTKGR